LPYDRAMQPVFGQNRVSVVTQDRRYRVLEGRR
jgi:16S rRNA G1207 methylase RsmC